MFGDLKFIRLKVAKPHIIYLNISLWIPSLNFSPFPDSTLPRSRGSKLIQNRNKHKSKPRELLKPWPCKVGQDIKHSAELQHRGGRGGGGGLCQVPTHACKLGESYMQAEKFTSSNLSKILADLNLLRV